MSTSLYDMEEGTSNCCGAIVRLGICSDCKEHCDIDEMERQDEIREDTTAMEEKLKALFDED